MSTSEKRPIEEQEEVGKASKKVKFSFRFPGRHTNGAANVFQKDIGHRDNSLSLETLFSHTSNSVSFIRPMQLGKTTLISLAEELFSVNSKSNVESDLKYSPGPGDRNNWYVLRLDFGNVCNYSSLNFEDDEGWARSCKISDEKVETHIKQKMIVLLWENPQLRQAFNTVSSGTPIKDQAVDTLLGSLTNAVRLADGRLLFLVDEYDLPIREGLLHLIPHHSVPNLYENVKQKMKATFGSYFAFFRAVRASLENLPYAKIILTGITPIGIKEMTGLMVESLTFKEDMADAVGLGTDDVNKMLDDVHRHVPFGNGERQKAYEIIKERFNNLYFLGGSALYHTALVNQVMNMMLHDPNERKEFLRYGRLPDAISRAQEQVPLSVYRVLENARNLRPVVNKLVSKQELTGHTLNTSLTLEDLLQEEIDIGDYLTLLFHVGVVSATKSHNETGICTTFRITSEAYLENLLQPLLKTLRVSLEALVALTSTDDLYAKGEDILVDFVTSISENSLAKLMRWASSDPSNHILELQFQSGIVSEAHDILKDVAQTTQEDILPQTGKRTDVTFSSASSVVILELKQVASATPPAKAFITKAHEQLAGYVQTRREMEVVGKKRPVAGFVVIMYNDGDKYVVEKLRNDNSS